MCTFTQLIEFPSSSNHLQQSPASEPSFYKCYTKTLSIACHCSHLEEAQTPVLLREGKKEAWSEEKKKEK
jgi:hypothetical protein